MLKKLSVVLMLSVLLADLSYGAGFALYEYSARGTAMGGATVANKAEPASLAVNPALITELDGTQAQLGLTVVTANAKTTVAGQQRGLKNDVWYLPNFYVTQKWSDQVSVGLGGFSRYGLGGEYKNWETWAGSQLAYKVKLETFSFTPTIAVKANDEFSVAMGLEAMVIGFTQNSTLMPGPAANATAYEISGSGVSWGGNFSFIYRPEWAEKWSLGAMYRTKVKQNLNGRIHAGMEYAARNIFDDDAKGAITLPDSLTAGVSFRPTEDLILEAGIVGTFWSAYDQILIEYSDRESTPTIHNKKDYKDTYRLNLGAEYNLNPNWAVRAGYVFDKSPINKHEMDTLVPVDDRHIASVGAGYHNDTWSVDLSYSHIFAKNLSGNSNSQFGSVPMKYTDGRSDMYGITVGYKF
ncbi:OmpP1/FadL family transporter [Candidatus Avelusimicrobium fimicolum]|jgi:long-chain fatty acid transport protein|uniref:OmpP1/FadL family transporter n=1 Tax=Candidatus Avelusimicrobium fimicolum TaxID=3416216 RepID=UPI003D10C7A7